jgi:CRISPR/Cas system-associated exonuclease Cas4 (RecB family)
MPQTVKALTGTIVNYFTHCKRQCWLFSNMLNMEDNSEDVRIGKVLHELKNRGKVELAIDSIKLDKITDEYVIEMKKSDSDIEAAKAQLTYYLFVLRRMAHFITFIQTMSEASFHEESMGNTGINPESIII